MLLPTFTLPAHLTPVIPIRCLTGICRSPWDMGVCSTTSIFRIFLHIFDERRQLYGRERSSAVIGYASFLSGLTWRSSTGGQRIVSHVRLGALLFMKRSDRKRVVLGKRGSVRGGLGGRRKT